jgi:hypothetical protein
MKYQRHTNTNTFSINAPRNYKNKRVSNNSQDSKDFDYQSFLRSRNSQQVSQVKFNLRANRKLNQVNDTQTTMDDFNVTDLE